ncbi:MAG: GLPGLI family protein [Bacteroidetes bacterium]|nr:GLPGLI family protein [Bacteroidota bacterium]
MKTLIYTGIFLITCLATSLIAKCQNTEPALLKVTYTFSYLYDTTNNTPPSETEVTLRVGKTNSKFNNAKLESPQRMPAKENSINPGVMMKVTTVVGTPIVVVTSKEVNKEIIYQIPDEKRIVKINRLGFQDYKIELPFPNISWIITQETKQVGDYTCQKATGKFGGRLYTAWFAPDLPFKYGPWKLCGLPGLILEAADADNEVVFKFKELKKPDIAEYIIYDAIRPVSIKENAFDKAKKQFDKDPIAYCSAQLKSDTPISQITFIDASGKAITGDEARKAIKEEQQKIINNPIEIEK